MANWIYENLGGGDELILPFGNGDDYLWIWEEYGEHIVSAIIEQEGIDIAACATEEEAKRAGERWLDEQGYRYSGRKIADKWETYDKSDSGYEYRVKSDYNHYFQWQIVGPDGDVVDEGTSSSLSKGQQAGSDAFKKVQQDTKTQTQNGGGKCKGTKKDGTPCNNPVKDGEEYCYLHRGASRRDFIAGYMAGAMARLR